MTDRTPTTTVYLPDPANDETLTMSGYDWWRYRAAIEAEARAPLDVGRVARIFHDRLDQSVLGHAGPVCQPCRQNAKAFAREYAALEEPTP